MVVLYVEEKEGKTPGDKVSVSYDLEYGSGTLEMGKVGMGGGEVVIVDDVLALVGHSKQLMNCRKGYKVVGNLVLVDLKYVPRVNDFDLNVRSVITYE